MTRALVALALAGGLARADVTIGDMGAGRDRCLEWPMRFHRQASAEPAERELQAVDQLIFRARLVSGRIELELGHAGPATALLAQLAATPRISPPALILLGDWHQRAGDPVLAKSYWLRARSLDAGGACAYELRKRLSS